MKLTFGGLLLLLSVLLNFCRILAESNKPLPSEVGLQIMVDGRVPTGSGLSSSSALTCAAAVAVMAARDLSFTKLEVADFTCKCERHCGTQSGGMDQVGVLY